MAGHPANQFARASPKKHKNTRLTNREKRIFPEIALAGPGRHPNPPRMVNHPWLRHALRPLSKAPRRKRLWIQSALESPVPAEHVPDSDRPDNVDFERAMVGGRAASVANGCPFWVRSCLISGKPGKSNSLAGTGRPSRDRLQTAPGITNSPTNTRLAGPTLPCAGWLLQDTRLRKSNHHRRCRRRQLLLTPHRIVRMPFVAAAELPPLTRVPATAIEISSGGLTG
jgi:hypothetical protein